MKKILVIGIGAGDPEHMTVQAINALNRVDAFFMLEKGASKRALVALRGEICRRYAKDRQYRVLEAPSPPRDTRPADYEACVEELNREKQAVFEALIAQMKEGECGAFLAWGDPSLYDSTIRNLDAVAASGRHTLEVEVIPGISAVQVLAARHRTTLNTVGQPVEITTGRRLREGWPEHVDSVVVMLDGEEAYRRFVDQDVEIFWGAYLGMPDEILIAGKLSDVADEIHQARAAARAEHGWIMDTYLMRKS